MVIYTSLSLVLINRFVGNCTSSLSQKGRDGERERHVIQTNTYWKSVFFFIPKLNLFIPIHMVLAYFVVYNFSVNYQNVGEEEEEKAAEKKTNTHTRWFLLTVISIKIMTIYFFGGIFLGRERWEEWKNQCQRQY